MSITGFAASPGTDVDPTCSIRSATGPNAVRRRCASSSKRPGKSAERTSNRVRLPARRAYWRPRNRHHAAAMKKSGASYVDRILKGLPATTAMSGAESSSSARGPWRRACQPAPKARVSQNRSRFGGRVLHRAGVRRGLVPKKCGRCRAVHCVGRRGCDRCARGSCRDASGYVTVWRAP